MRNLTAGLTLFSCAAALPGCVDTPARETPASSSSAAGLPATASVSPTVVVLSSAPMKERSGLHAVSWGDQRYDIDARLPMRRTEVQLTKGSAETHVTMKEWNGAHDFDRWTLVHVAYGDLDGDGADEAVVNLDRRYQAPRHEEVQEQWLFAFAWRDGNPVQVAKVRAGRGLMRTVSITGATDTTPGMVVIARVTAEAGMPTWWKWKDGQLVP